jgi:cell division protein FtsL
MTRLNLVLLLAVMVSALYLVRLQYESRQLVTALDRATGESRKLEVEHERLQAEKRAQATPLRVEKLAKEQLHMRGATPAITQYVSRQGDVIAAPASPASAPVKAAARAPAPANRVRP